MDSLLAAIFGNYAGMAKLIGKAIVAVVIVALIVWAILTVLAWRADSQKLPAVEKERDEAVHTALELDKHVTSKLDDVINKIGALQQRYDDVEKLLTQNGRAIDGAVANFKKATDHVSNNPAPGSANDRFIRDELRKLLANPDTGGLTRPAGGGSQARPGAQMPATPAAPDNLPGRPAGTEDQQGLLVPAAGQRSRGGRRRAAQRCHRRSDRLGRERDGLEVPVDRVGSLLPGSFVHVRRAGRWGARFEQALTNLARAAAARLHAG